MNSARKLQLWGTALAAVLLAAPAFADAPNDDEAACPEGQVRDPKTSECTAKPKKRRKKKHAKVAPKAPGESQKALPHATEDAPKAGQDAGSGSPDQPTQQVTTSPKADEAPGAPRLCPEGQKLERVVCIRAPCPPQCVPIAR